MKADEVYAKLKKMIGLVSVGMKNTTSTQNPDGSVTITINFTSGSPLSFTMTPVKGDKGVGIKDAQIKEIQNGENTEYHLILIDDEDNNIDAGNIPIPSSDSYPDITNLATKSDLTTHTSDTNIHITTAERNKWNAKLDNTDLTDYATKTYVADEINKASLSGGTVDLSDYAKIADVNSALNTKVDKVTGKSLVDDTEIARLATINNYDDTDIKNTLNNKANKTDLFSGDYDDLTNKPTIPDVSNLASKTELRNHIVDSSIHVTSSEKNKWNNKAETSDIPDLTNYATKTYVTDEIVKASTSGTVDLSGYAKTDDVNSALDTKVDKVDGKSLISDTEIARLELVDNYDDTQITKDIADLDINKQDKTDNSLYTTDKTVVGAINEINSNLLDNITFSADYKNIIINRKSGLNPYTIPISSIIHNAKIIELNDVDTTNIGNGKSLVYDGTTKKHKYVSSTGTDELVKMDSTTDAKHLSELIDKSTIVNDNGTLKVKKLDGQEVTIAEINYLKGLTMNVMDLVNVFSNGGVKVLTTPVATYADLSKLDRSTFIDGISYIVYVLADENYSGEKTTYLCDKTSETFFGNASGHRGFTTDPIDLSSEVTGKLAASNIDVDGLWSLLTINNTYKTLTSKNEVFGTHGAKALYDELVASIGEKANATDLTTHTSDTNIHITTAERNKLNEVDNKIESLKTSQSIEYGGKSITCRNTLASRTSDMLIKGQTNKNASKIESAGEKENKISILSKNKESVDDNNYKQDKKEILLPVDGGLKSLPNNVADTIEQRNDGVYLVQRVGKVVLNGSERWDRSSWSMTNTFKFDFEIGLVAKLFDTNATNQILCDTFEVFSRNSLDNVANREFENICASNSRSRTLSITISKTKLNNTNTTVAFKQWLSNNPVTACYELATPVETKLDINNLDLEVYKDTTYITTDNTIQPTLSFKVPSNIGGVIQGNAQNINKLYKYKVDKVDGKGLSTNDYTTEEKTKVGKIVTNGNGASFLANDGTYKKVSSSASSAVAERKFKPVFGFDTYWGEMRDNHGNKNQVDLVTIKQQIDECESMKVDRIICTIHLGWDETTNSLVIAENTDSISTAISYCNGKNVTIDTAKIHVHFKGTSTSEKDYINDVIGMSTFQTKYKAMLTTICNLFKDTTVTRIIILNEMWYITNAKYGYSSFVNECLNIVKSAGYTTGLSMAGFNSNLELSNAVIQNIDTFYINVYPGISGFGSYITKSEAIEAFKQCDIDLWIEKTKKKYPDKKIVISEMGTDDYWENLAAPSSWQVTGTSKTGGHAVDTYITAMMEFFTNKNVEIEELWWWYNLYYEPVKETLLNYLGGDR